MLEGIFKSSPDGAKVERNGQHEEEKHEKEPSPELSNFKKLNRMFFSRIDDKVRQLKSIETMWELTNLNFKDQTLVTRSHSSSRQGKVERIVNS